MSYGAKKVAWILGAGFSRSLGGPLLADLLTERGDLEFKSRFPKLKDTYLFHPYLQGLRGYKTASMSLWGDAEEFLEFVELARKPGSAQDILSKLLLDHGPNIPIEDFRRKIIQSVAGDCSFATFGDPALEAWEPYLDWYKTLGENDTVISFNYDTVVERLGKHLKTDTVKTVLPWDDKTQPTRPMLLKLHGSVDWCYGQEQTDPVVPHTGFVVTSFKRPQSWAAEEGMLPLIGTPGPSKSVFRKAHFDRLWDLALHHIRQADVIVFFGYRFPPSDAQSRSELLGAIRKNKSNYLRVHIVLGPDVNHENTLRLDKMLEVILQQAGRIPVEELAHTSSAGPKPDHYKIIKQPLYVQDFMTILNETFLNGAL